MPKGECGPATIRIERIKNYNEYPLFLYCRNGMKLAKISIGRVTKVDIIEGSPGIGRLDINNAGISLVHNPVCTL